jgi:hypothetical protein
MATTTVPNSGKDVNGDDGTTIRNARTKLPDRRPNETVELMFNDTRYAATVGYYPDTGRVGEVFTHGAKVGSAMDAILDDACVALSMLLQHGTEPGGLASSMGRLGDGRAPASIIGALADLLVDMDTESGKVAS